MIDDTVIILVKKIAPQFSLDPALVCAIIEQESGGDTWAMRYEPAFYTRYIVPLLAAGQIQPRADSSAETEAMARATSWGLLQVLGETAREAPVNYYGPLAALCDPNTGITVGCRVFAAKLEAAGGDTAKGLLRWNGGGNLNYPAQVLARLTAYKTTSV